MITVKSLNQLKRLCNINGFAEFSIKVANGLAKSSKRIRYYPENRTFDIHNEIDDSWQEDITEEDLNIATKIPESIKKNALVYTGFQLHQIK